MLIFAATMKLKEGAPSLSTNTVELANDGHGEHRASHARRATRLTVVESEESYSPTESVTRLSREGRAAYEAERE